MLSGASHGHAPKITILDSEGLTMLVQKSFNKPHVAIQQTMAQLDTPVRSEIGEALNFGMLACMGELHHPLVAALGRFRAPRLFSFNLLVN